MGIVGKSIVKDFDTDLKFSNNSDLVAKLDTFYKLKIPHLSKINRTMDIKFQKAGIDLLWVLESGKRIAVDEKVRRKDYGDFHLEEYSNYEKRTVGWMSSSKHTDYISYVVLGDLKIKRITLIPFFLLQLAWHKNYKEWLSLFKRWPSKNKGYTTTSIPIPRNVLFLALEDVMEIDCG